MDPDGHENQDKYGHIPDHKERLGGDKIGEEGAGEENEVQAAPAAPPSAPAAGQSC